MNSDMSGRKSGTRSRSAEEMLDCVAAGKKSQPVQFYRRGSRC